MGARPNIVIFMPDQQRADAIGAFGNRVVQTPHIDALAARGVRFDEAWGQHSVCGPSRISMMTGWYPHVAGHRTLDNLLGPDEPNLLCLLRDGGYQVAMAGNRGDVFAPGVTEASTDLCGYLVPPAKGLFADLRMAHPEGHRMYQAFYFGGQGDELRLDSDEAAVQTAVAWIDEVGRGDQPFALWVPLINPHPPFMVEEPWFSLHDRADVPLPIRQDQGVAKPAFMDEYREAGGWIYQHKTDIQTEMPHLVGKAQAIRSATHTYIYRQCESDELYLRDRDPQETVNVIDDPAQADVVSELRGRLLDWLVATSDVIPWDADPRFPEIPHGWRDR